MKSHYVAVIQIKGFASLNLRLAVTAFIIAVPGDVRVIIWILSQHLFWVRLSINGPILMVWMELFVTFCVPVIECIYSSTFRHNCINPLDQSSTEYRENQFCDSYTHIICFHNVMYKLICTLSPTILFTKIIYLFQKHKSTKFLEMIYNLRGYIGTVW